MYMYCSAVSAVELWFVAVVLSRHENIFWQHSSPDFARKLHKIYSSWDIASRF